MPDGVPSHTPVNCPICPLLVSIPAGSRRFTTADLDVLSKSAIPTKVSALSLVYTQIGDPKVSERSFVVQRINPASVPTKRRGVSPGLSTCRDTEPVAFFDLRVCSSASTVIRFSIDISPWSKLTLVVWAFPPFPKIRRAPGPIDVDNGLTDNIGSDCKKKDESRFSPP